MPGRDIIVVGASAGGVQALSDLVRGLPADLPAAVFIVVHTSPTSPGILPEILQRTGPLEAAHCRNGEPIRHGRIYVAPPDHHMVLRDDLVELTRGPRENGFRPAVDPLFRTAARRYGRRVVGVVLSGGLDDGCEGLALIKQYGGLAVVQEPAEAVVPSMPANAIATVSVDHVLPAGAGLGSSSTWPPASRCRKGTRPWNPRKNKSSPTCRKWRTTRWPAAACPAHRRASPAPSAAGRCGSSRAASSPATAATWATATRPRAW